MNSEEDGEDVFAREILRVVGEDQGQLQKVFLVLPLVNEQDALDFLRTLPEKTAPETIQRLALEWRLDHPIVDHGTDEKDG